MKYMRAIIAKHPSYSADHNGELVSCIEACMSSAAATAACADACLAEAHSDEMATCIRLNLDCSDLSHATARMLSRHVGHLTQAAIAQINALAAVAQACSLECDSHSEMATHCEICALACRACAEACRKLTGASADLRVTSKGVEQEAALH